MVLFSTMSDNVSSDIVIAQLIHSLPVNVPLPAHWASTAPWSIFKFKATLTACLIWWLGNRATINNYCLLTLLKVSWVTAEKTVWRWAVFAGCCYFKDGTADTEKPVISDAALFSFLHFKIQLWEKWDFFFFANIGTVRLCLSVSCLCLLYEDIKESPLRGLKNACHCKKRFCATKQWVNETESSQNVRPKSLLRHVFKHQIHLLSWDFSGMESSTPANYYIPTSNMCIPPWTTLKYHGVSSDKAVKAPLCTYFILK